MTGSPLVSPVSTSEALKTDTGHNDTTSPLKPVKTPYRYLYGAMLVSAVVSLVAAFVLSVDAVTLAKNPNASLSCNISSIISCGKVGTTWQANLFGFPNAFFGLVCEPVVITIAVAGLSGVKFPRWFMVTAQAVYLLGLVFALWLFTQSAFYIHAFCPWCLLVTLGTTVTFFTMLRLNLMQNNILSEDSRIKRVIVSSRLDTALEIIVVLLVVSTILIMYGPGLMAGF